MRELRLKDLGRWFSGGTPPRDQTELWDGDVPWISAKDFESDHLRGPVAFITAQAARTHSRIVPMNSILLIVRGMALAHGLPVARCESSVAFNQDLRALVCADGVLPRFIYYALVGNRRHLNRHIDRAAHGTARVTDSIYAERLRVPDLQAQMTIADFLDDECDRIEEIVGHRSGQIAELETLTSAVVRERVKPLRKARLKTAFTVVDCKHRTPDYVDSGFPLISTREVARGRLRVDEATRRVSAADFRDLRGGGRDPRLGDIVYSRNASVGIAAYLDDETQVCMGQDVVLITRRPRDCELLAYVLNYGIADQVDRLSVGSTFSRINVSTIRELRVPSGEPDAEQSVLAEIKSKFEAIAEARSQLGAAGALLTEYRDSLIAEAVTGDLDATCRSDQQLDEAARAAMEGKQAEVLSS